MWRDCTYGFDEVKCTSLDEVDIVLSTIDKDIGEVNLLVENSQMFKQVRLHIRCIFKNLVALIFCFFWTCCIQTIHILYISFPFLPAQAPKL